MLVIGSRAMAHRVKIDRTPVDWDFICTFEQFQKWCRDNKANIAHCVPLSGDKYHVRDKDGMNYEFEFAWEGTSAEILLNMYFACAVDGPLQYASLFTCLMLKESHKYRKDNPHFLKTMKDIHFLRKVCGVEGHLDMERLFDNTDRKFMELRLKETYNYSHPKLDVTKKDFFTGDGVGYVYDHDSIHLTVALQVDADYDNTPEHEHLPVMVPRPAYTYYMKDGSEVMTSKEKFFAVPEQIRLYGVYEESCVLALERSQIPHGFGKEGGPTARWSFLKALEKVCTSITSGWFREYAWENYDKVVALYEEMGEDDYVKRFQANQHLLKPFKEGMM